MIKPVEWTKDGVRMLDQRLLPSEETYLMLRSYEEVAEAIRKMPASQSELRSRISKTIFYTTAT
jgi:methylthioribose-1-phosphate isomerase